MMRLCHLPMILPRPSLDLSQLGFLKHHGSISFEILYFFLEIWIYMKMAPATCASFPNRLGSIPHWVASHTSSLFLCDERGGGHFGLVSVEGVPVFAGDSDFGLGVCCEGVFFVSEVIMCVCSFAPVDELVGFGPVEGFVDHVVTWGLPFDIEWAGDIGGVFVLFSYYVG